jgi:hypothetical protein
MTAEVFGVLLQERILQMRAVLGVKAKEYASSTDRLHNFKTAATLPCAERGYNMGSETPGQALMGMLRKHWVSVMDMVNGHAEDVQYTDKQIDEKIGDAINYLVLLEALLKERK